MANRFFNPFSQFLTADPAVREAARLFFYASGTSTKLNTYSNSTLSVANANPITLNALGASPVEIFLQNLPYKVVLAPPGSDDPPSSPIWTSDPFYSSDYSTAARFTSGSGNPNGLVAGTAGSALTLADAYWDYTNGILYVCTTTGIAAAAVWTAINASASTTAPPAPQGRLTLSSGLPIMTSSVTGGAATVVYYTPYVGDTIPIYNGTTMSPTVFSEISLSLVSAHATNQNYDLFVFNNSGVLRLVTGPAWTSDTGRGAGAGTTQISRVKGINLNAVSMTARNGSTTYSVPAQRATYVGTIRTVAAGQTAWRLGTAATNGGNAEFCVWNAYNRVTVATVVRDTTNSWTLAITSTRSANNSTTMRVTLVNGENDEAIDASYLCACLIDPGGGQAGIGIGLDSTSAYTGRIGSKLFNANASAILSVEGGYRGLAGLGFHYIQALETSATFGTQTFYGDIGVSHVQNGLAITIRA